MASMSAESEPFVLESVPLDSRHVRMHLSEKQKERPSPGVSRARNSREQ